MKSIGNFFFSNFFALITLATLIFYSGQLAQTVREDHDTVADHEKRIMAIEVNAKDDHDTIARLVAKP